MIDLAMMQVFDRRSTNTEEKPLSMENARQENWKHLHVLILISSLKYLILEVYFNQASKVGREDPCLQRQLVLDGMRL